MVISIFSWIIFFLVEFMIADLIPKWVFKSDLFNTFWEEQCDSSISKIQDFVEENHMTVEEVREYNFSDFEHTSVRFHSYIGYTQMLEGRFTKAKIVCSDGIFYPKKYVPSDIYWKSWNYMGIVIAFIFSEMIILSYIYKLVRRMKKLYSQIISTDLKKKVPVIGVEGRDELSILGDKVETMRTMLIQSLDAEMDQRQRQTKLIASLSHDIRTPLTKIITCLDILNYKLAKSEEERQNCISMMTSKANQLKCLTDRLLNSVTCGGEYIVYQREIYDGPSTLSQFLFEGSYYLEEEGFKVCFPKTISGTYQLNIDIVALRRVADNIYSNIQKYADKKALVNIWIEEKEKEVEVHVKNNKKIDAPYKRQESYGIGLTTIKQIMSEMGGRSEIENTNEFFIIKLVLPKYE